MTECIIKLDGRVVRVHLAAQLLPMMSDEELDELAADIAKNGLQQPLVFLGEALLDGRNRVLAILRIPDPVLRAEIMREALERAIVYQHLDDPFGYVLSANVHRRHLTRE